MTPQTASSAQRSRLAVGYVLGGLGSILGEAMSGMEWLGAALIIAGVGWFTLTERK